jgi:hypothetical protein
VSQLLSVLDTVLDVDPRDLVDRQLADVLVDFELVRRRLDAAEARALAEFDQRRAHEQDGFPTTKSWLQARCQVSGGAANARVRLARTLPQLHRVQAALSEGRISAEHAQAISALTTVVPLQFVQGTEAEFVTVAERVDPQSLRNYLRGIRHAYQPDAVVAAEEDQYQRRQFHLTSSFEGMLVMSGQGDPETGAIVQTAISALAQPAGPDDERSVGQRQYDGLVGMCRAWLDSGQLPSQGGVRPHVSIVADLPTAMGAPGARMADLGYPGKLSGEALRRILCEAQISRLITDGPSEILDLGRAVRTVTPAQRRALVIRDKECVWPGCRVPHQRCDAHHLIFWMFGGRSDLTNYALLCPAHHRYVHEGQWTLRRDHDGTWTADPPLAQTA